MKTWITSDLHLFHKNIINHCPKYRSHFTSVEHMNSELVSEWNTKIAADDQVFFLGDMSFCKKPEDLAAIVQTLKGNITWLIGNHDKHLLKGLRHLPITFRDYAEIRFDNHKIVLQHFPIFSWNGMHRGDIHLHGHCHGSIEHHNVNTRRTDVGWDVYGRILELKEAVEITMKKPISTPEGDHHSTDRVS